MAIIAIRPWIYQKCNKKIYKQSNALFRLLRINSQMNRIRNLETHNNQQSFIYRIEMCRCPASAVEAVCRGLPNLKSLSALAIRDALLDPSPLGTLAQLHELRLKSMSGLSLTRDLRPLAELRHLQHLSLTSIKVCLFTRCSVKSTPSFTVQKYFKLSRLR